VAVALVYVATTALVLGVALSRGGRRPAQVADDAMQFALSAPGVTACAFVSAGMLAMVTVVAARWQGRDIRALLRLAPTPASVLGLVAAVFGMAGLSLASGAAGDLLGMRGHGAMGAIAHALERPTPAKFVIALATIAIAPAVAEEAFFRGLIQTRLAARWGRWPAIVATSLGFGLIHLDLVQGSVACIAGLFLGWVVERTSLSAVTNLTKHTPRAPDLRAPARSRPACS
jgi:membrane protease YdiL (CAAX protease family)